MLAKPEGKKPAKIGTEARNVKTSVRTRVLHEAGYKCSNPRCRYRITLDVHHVYYVSEGGSDDPANLLPLCPTCHAEHHMGRIPTESLRAWKVLLLAINEAFDRRSVDVLITVYSLGRWAGFRGPSRRSLPGRDAARSRRSKRPLIGPGLSPADGPLDHGRLAYHRIES